MSERDDHHRDVVHRSRVTRNLNQSLLQSTCPCEKRLVGGGSTEQEEKKAFMILIIVVIIIIITVILIVIIVIIILILVSLIWLTLDSDSLQMGGPCISTRSKHLWSRGNPEHLI